MRIEIEEGYPNIRSGRIFFENVRTGEKIKIGAPTDLDNMNYGIKQITVDTGADKTVLPTSFSEILNIQEPSKGERVYCTFSGITGAGIGFLISDPIRITISDGNEKFERAIHPVSMIGAPPQIITDAFKDKERFEKRDLSLILPRIQPQNDYEMKVFSPESKFNFSNGLEEDRS